MIEINKIYCEDNLQTMARMPDGFIDLTVTSPPYDNLRTYNGYQFDFEATARELFRVTKKGGVVVWVVGDTTVDGSETLTSAEQKIYFRKECGFNILDTMIYEKAGSLVCGSLKAYRQVFEYKFVLSKGTPATVNLLKDKPNITFGKKTGVIGTRNRDGTHKFKGAILVNEYAVRGNIWRYQTGNNGNDYTGHPAVYPEGLAIDHVYSWSNEGDLVYDPFMGSGTTAKAAHQLGRNWIGSEISEEYVALANKRLEPYLMQTNLFV